MGFKMSSEASKYLNKINRNSTSGKFPIDFDFYYLCFILGVTFRKCAENIEGKEFVKEFPNKYATQNSLLIGLLLEAELSRTGIDTSNRDHLEKFILKFVDPKSVTRLSSEGEEKMNCYAQGGFEKFVEVSSSVDSLDSFLIQYYELINRVNDQNEK